MGFDTDGLMEIVQDEEIDLVDAQTLSGQDKEIFNLKLKLKGLFQRNDLLKSELLMQKQVEEEFQQQLVKSSKEKLYALKEDWRKKNEQVEADRCESEEKLI